MVNFKPEKFTALKKYLDFLRLHTIKTPFPYHTWSEICIPLSPLQTLYMNTIEFQKLDRNSHIHNQNVSLFG